MKGKKKSKLQNQPKLRQYITSQHTVKCNIPRQERIKNEIERLVKVRKELQSKKCQQSKIIHRLLKLQIQQVKESKVKEDRQLSQIEEEYTIFTKEVNLSGLQNPSMFKLILGDYGLPQIKQKKPKTQELLIQDKQKVEQASIEYEQIESTTLNQQYLSEYSQQFVHYLKAMQATAETFTSLQRINRF